MVIGSSARVTATLNAWNPDQRNPKKEGAQPKIDIAKNKAEHGHGNAFLIISPRPELSAGTMPAKGPERGNQDETKEK